MHRKLGASKKKANKTIGTGDPQQEGGQNIQGGAGTEQCILKNKKKAGRLGLPEAEKSKGPPDASVGARERGGEGKANQSEESQKVRKIVRNLPVRKDLGRKLKEHMGEGEKPEKPQKPAGEIGR